MDQKVAARRTAKLDTPNEAERRTWFLFEATRAGETPGR
jgi:hypothetical protein